MYKVVFFRLNKEQSKEFKTFREAMSFYGKLPFETFSELYKV